MSEIETKAYPVIVNYECDSCKEGLMVQKGDIAWLTDPIQFPHECNHCKHTHLFTKKYPLIEYRSKPL